MNESGKDFIYYYKPYAFSRPSWSSAHFVCTESVPASSLALDLHAHAQCYCLLLLGQRGGGVEGCIYTQISY